MRLPFDALAGNAGRKATPALASECAREVRKVPRVLQTQDHANRPLAGLAHYYYELDQSAPDLIAAEAAGIEDQTDGEQRSKAASAAAAGRLEK